MNRKITLVAVIALAMAIGVFLLLKAPQLPGANSLSSPPHDSLGSSEASPMAQQSASPLPSSTIASPSSNPLQPVSKDQLPAQYPLNPLMPPSLRQLREEVARNPHSTPLSLIRFAQDLGHRTSIAKTSDPAAEKLFADLENCMQNANAGEDRTPPQAQTACLSTAEELAIANPERYRARFDDLSAQASDEVKRLRRALKTFQ